MTLLRELIEIPEHVQKGDFVLRLSEGVIDHLRSVEGTRVAAVVRHIDDERKKISLRSIDGRIDVSAIARQAGGGGHRRAAGVTTTMSEDEIVAFLREQIAAQAA